MAGYGGIWRDMGDMVRYSGIRRGYFKNPPKIRSQLARLALAFLTALYLRSPRTASPLAASRTAVELSEFTPLARLSFRRVSPRIPALGRLADYLPSSVVRTDPRRPRPRLSLSARTFFFPARRPLFCFSRARSASLVGCSSLQVCGLVGSRYPSPVSSQFRQCVRRPVRQGSQSLAPPPSPISVEGSLLSRAST